MKRRIAAGIPSRKEDGEIDSSSEQTRATFTKAKRRDLMGRELNGQPSHGGNNHGLISQDGENKQGTNSECTTAHDQ